MSVVHESQVIPVTGVALQADIVVPESAQGVVLFAHGSGSSRHSPRHRYVAGELQKAGLAPCHSQERPGLNGDGRVAEIGGEPAGGVRLSVGGARRPRVTICLSGPRSRHAQTGETLSSRRYAWVCCVGTSSPLLMGWRTTPGGSLLTSGRSGSIRSC